MDALILDCGPWLALHLDLDVYKSAAAVVEKIRIGIVTIISFNFFRGLTGAHELDSKPCV